MRLVATSASIAAILAATTAGATPIAAAGSTTTASRVSATVAPVSLPELSGRVEEVVATITTDRRVRWSAQVQIVDGDAIQVLPVNPLPHQEVLEPGRHRVILGTTRLFAYVGRHWADLRFLNPDTRATISEQHLSVVVRGRLAKPHGLRVTRDGSRVKVRGHALPFPDGTRIEVSFRRAGHDRFRPIRRARVDASGVWTAAIKTRHAGAVRVRAVSPYGVSPFTKPRRVARAR
jgi:hypothetical protein